MIFEGWGVCDSGKAELNSTAHKRKSVPSQWKHCCHASWCLGENPKSINKSALSLPWLYLCKVESFLEWKYALLSQMLAGIFFSMASSLIVGRKKKCWLNLGSHFERQTMQSIPKSVWMPIIMNDDRSTVVADNGVSLCVQTLFSTL